MGTEKELISALVGTLVSLVNGITFIVVAVLSINQDFERFTKTVYTSFVVRYFIVAASIWTIFILADIDKLYFAISFAISCFLLIITEILIINFSSKFRNFVK